MALRGLLSGAALLAASLSGEAVAQTAPVPRPEAPLSQSTAPAPRPEGVDSAEETTPEEQAAPAPEGNTSATPEPLRPPSGPRPALTPETDTPRPAPRPERVTEGAAPEHPLTIAPDNTSAATTEGDTPPARQDSRATEDDQPTASADAATPSPDPAPQSDNTGTTLPLWFTQAESLPSFIGCIAALTAMGADFEIAETLTDAETDHDCGIRRPVNVAHILPGIPFEGGAMLRCETALALALWTHEVVLPAAARLDGAPKVTAYLPGSSFACRPRAGTDRLSEHAVGNAIDIAGFRLSDGQTVMIEPREGDRLAAFQRAVQAGACQFFTTVLGPGSDAAHDDHLHLDVIARGNGWRICQ